MPLTCRYGPAGRFTRPNAASLTAPVVLLIRTRNVPPALTLGTVSATVPLKSAASPAALSNNVPLPPVTFNIPPPKLRLTLLAVSFSAPAFDPVVTFEKLKLPLNVWPTTERVALFTANSATGAVVAKFTVTLLDEKLIVSLTT